MSTPRVRAIRGATTVEHDTREQVIALYRVLTS